MKKFKDFVIESNTITVYHGDNYGTTKLLPEFMNNGNNQEGIGIYFGSLETAKYYGKYIVSLEIQKKNFVNSRESMFKHLRNSVFKILKELFKIDKESMWSLATDYGVEVYEPENLTLGDVKKLSNNMIDEEVRNFQITLAEYFGVDNFVKVWNKVLPNVYGTYYPNSTNEDWYAVINTNLKVNKV